MSAIGTPLPERPKREPVPNPEAALSLADRENPEKVTAAWEAACKRPATALARDAAKQLRLERRKDCGGNTLAFVTPARASDGRVACAHPTIGVVVFADEDLFNELGAVDWFDDGQHDRKWLRGYFSAEIRSGKVQLLDALPDDWKPLKIP